MAALSNCVCALKVKDLLGDAYSTAELSVEPRKSQVNSSDAIYIGKPVRSKATHGKVIQDILYSALAINPSITVTYTAGGTAGSEVVTVVGKDITVQIQSSVSTAAQIKTAVEASAAAMALITPYISGTAATAQVTVSATTLNDHIAVLDLAETTTNTQSVIFQLNWNDFCLLKNLFLATP